MTFDARTYVHCECGLWVNERLDLIPSAASRERREGNARCVHEESAVHFHIQRD